MKKINIQPFILVVVVVFSFSSCTSFRTRDGVYRVADTELAEIETETETIEDEVVSSELIDIMDEGLALGVPEMAMPVLDLSYFTNMGSSFLDQLKGDVAANLSEDQAYASYERLTIVPKDDLMSVMAVELAYFMDGGQGEWTDRRRDYPSGNGYTLSSFSENEGILTYDLTYKDNSGTMKTVGVTYNRIEDCFDYVSESFDGEGVLIYKVWQQFARSFDGGYFYQALRHSIADDMERASFSYFDGSSYETYIRSTEDGSQLEGFSYDLYKGHPEDLETLMKAYQPTVYFSNNGMEGFRYNVFK